MLKHVADIDIAKDYAELGKLSVRSVHGKVAALTGHRCAYNFDNLYLVKGSKFVEENIPKTIEFRQHTGTLDTNEITSWILTVISLVHFAHHVSDIDQLQLVLKGFDPTFTTIGLLKVLGVCPKVLDYYACKLSGDLDAANALMQLSTPPARAAIQPVLERIERQCYADSKASKIQATIKAKTTADNYGLAGSRNFAIPAADVMQEMHVQAMLWVSRTYPEEHEAAVIESLAKNKVLMDLWELC